MSLMDTYLAMPIPSDERQTRACNCVGPRNGDPVCPCMMPAYTRRKLADAALDLVTRRKPRFRVKAGRREVST